MEQEYILRLYDTDLLTFSLSEHGIEGLKAEIHEINQAERSRFPEILSLWTIRESGRVTPPLLPRRS